MATENDTSGPNELYVACLKGDVKFVRDYLTTHPDIENELNMLEPIFHSTPLHAASQNGHKDIVRLLIESGCDRSHTDEHGLTAYEVAANDEIRQVFKRPTGPGGTERFFEEDISECFSLLKDPEAHVSINKDQRNFLKIVMRNCQFSSFYFVSNTIIHLTIKRKVSTFEIANSSNRI